MDKLTALVVSRFWARVEKSDGCWLWTGQRNPKGYGLLTFRGTDSRVIALRAHRISWELQHGPIAEGLCVCHRCDVPNCVNPDHLWLGTVGDNNRDRDSKGRLKGAIGEAHGHAKLTEQQVREIRSLAGSKSYREIAKDFGVSDVTINKAVNRQTWRHVE